MSEPDARRALATHQRLQDMNYWNEQISDPETMSLSSEHFSTQ